MTLFAWTLTLCLAQPGDVAADIKLVSSYQFKQNPRPALEAFRRLVKAKAIEWPMKQFDVAETLEKTVANPKVLPDFKVNSFASSLWQNSCRIDAGKPREPRVWLTNNQGIYCYALFITELLNSYAHILADSRFSNNDINYPIENSSLQLSQLRFAITKAGGKFPNSNEFLATIKQFYNPLPLNTEAGTARGLRSQGMRSVADSLQRLTAPNLK
jgi:hypothetical protein